MTATMVQVGKANNRNYRADVVVAAASTTSEVIDCSDGRLIGLLLPSGIHSATSVTFLVSDQIDGTYVALYTAEAAAVLATVAVSRAVALPPEKLAPWPFVKVVFSTTQTAGITFKALGLGY